MLYALRFTYAYVRTLGPGMYAPANTHDMIWYEMIPSTWKRITQSRPDARKLDDEYYQMLGTWGIYGYIRAGNRFQYKLPEASANTVYVVVRQQYVYKIIFQLFPTYI